ncbi:CvpA family protein [Candidatus Purcelliella pentastirinorum]|uniref:CvpA family protein n=1 Tax=Candidatus Purcelliella pentastirinorum TaxID=472834 RepID=UPI002367B3D4|nr:CvpA family protein [Candidatus Purcelliella pentastirinorum]WDI78815.1 CvpA family protein [Candidatus Purcelliella pentastirinorum]WDR79948.1 CvpA family protein [Candidatus Purcelliella pentastirinorum]
MNLIDYFIFVIILLSAFFSLMKGFTNEILSIFTYILAFFIVKMYYKFIGSLFIGIKEEFFRNIISILLISIFIFICGSLFNYFIYFIIKKIHLVKIDKKLGLIFGIIKGILIVTVGIYFINTFTELFKYSLWKNSKIIPFFKCIIKWFSNYLHYISFFKKNYIWLFYL